MSSTQEDRSLIAISHQQRRPLKLTDLPPELLIQAFESLPTCFPFFRIASVCRLFYNLTASLRFRSIALSRNNSMTAFSNSILEEKEGKEKKPLDTALFIRELTILGNIYSNKTEEEADAFFEEDDDDSDTEGSSSENDKGGERLLDRQEIARRKFELQYGNLTHYPLLPFVGRETTDYDSDGDSLHDLEGDGVEDGDDKSYTSSQAKKERDEISETSSLQGEEEEAEEYSQKDLDGEGGKDGDALPSVDKKEGGEETIKDKMGEVAERVELGDQDSMGKGERVVTARTEEDLIRKEKGKETEEPEEEPKDELIEIRLCEAIRFCVNLEALILLQYDSPAVRPLIDAIRIFQPFKMLTRLEIHDADFRDTWNYDSPDKRSEDIMLILAQSTKGLRILKLVRAALLLRTSIFCYECSKSWSDLRELVLIGFESQLMCHDHTTDFDHFKDPLNLDEEGQQHGDFKTRRLLRESRREHDGSSFTLFLRGQQRLETLHIDNMEQSLPQINLIPYHHPAKEPTQEARGLVITLLSSQLNAWPCLTVLNAPLKQCYTLLEAPQPLMRDLSVTPSCNDDDELWPQFFERLAQRASSDNDPLRLRKANFAYPRMSFNSDMIKNMICGCNQVQELYSLISTSDLLSYNERNTPITERSDMEIARRLAPFGIFKGSKLRKLMVSAGPLLGDGSMGRSPRLLLKTLDFMHSLLVVLIDSTETTIVFG